MEKETRVADPIEIHSLRKRETERERERKCSSGAHGEACFTHHALDAEAIRNKKFLWLTVSCQTIPVLNMSLPAHQDN